MITELLQSAGLTFRHVRFLKPPQCTYAVWLDNMETDGGDNQKSGIFEHNYTVEIYEPTPDDASEQAIETALDTAGIQYNKQDRYWLQDEQRYQTVYDFIITNKERES